MQREMENPALPPTTNGEFQIPIDEVLLFLNVPEFDGICPTPSNHNRTYAVRFVVVIKGANSDCDRDSFIARLL